MRTAMIAALAALAWAAAGCGGPQVREGEGRVVYRGLTKDREGAPVFISIATGQAQIQVDTDEGPRLGKPAPGEAPQPVAARVTPREMGELLAKLEDMGFFALPGRATAPDLPAPRSISVETKDHRFYVSTIDLKSDAQVEVYSRASREIVHASLGGARIGEGDVRAGH